MKDDLILIVAKVNIIKNNISGQLNIIHGAVSLMCVLPCPHTGMLNGFGEDTIYLFRIDQSNVAVIHLNFFIQ